MTFMNTLGRLRGRTVPAHWAEALDFAGPRVHTAPWAWLLLLAGLVAMAALLPRVLQLDADQADAEAALHRLQRAGHQLDVADQARARARLAASGSAAGRGPGAPVSAEQARHALQLAQWLAYPWLDVLDEADRLARQEQAVMLSFNLDLAPLGLPNAPAPELRLSAAVQDDAAALRWALSGGPGAQLLSRERLATAFTTSAGSYAWRAEASWQKGSR